MKAELQWLIQDFSDSETGATTQQGRVVFYVDSLLKLVCNGKIGPSVWFSIGSFVEYSNVFFEILICQNLLDFAKYNFHGRQ